MHDVLKYANDKWMNEWMNDDRDMESWRGILIVGGNRIILGLVKYLNGMVNTESPFKDMWLVEEVSL